MTNYRRNFVPGGSYFFTVNLADRRLRLLTQHVNTLRGVFRTKATMHATSTTFISSVKHGHASWCPAGLAYSSFHRMVRLGLYPADWGGDVAHHEATFGER